MNAFLITASCGTVTYVCCRTTWTVDAHTHTHTCRHTGIQTRSRKSRNRIKRSEAASLILLICDSFITYSDCNDASDSSVVTSQIPLTWLSSQITLSGRTKRCHVHCWLERIKKSLGSLMTNCKQPADEWLSARHAKGKVASPDNFFG